MNKSAYELQRAELLTQLNLHLATAESCTGGLIGHRITNIPGSSNYYLGGLVAYANQLKTTQLGVNTQTLERYGAVSRETVLEMARGVRIALSADIGLSVSGIAGPGGGTPEKPVGLTWIGLSAENYEQAWSYLWSGSRLQIKQQAADKALELLVEYLAAEAIRTSSGMPPHGQLEKTIAPHRKEYPEMEPVETTIRFGSNGEVSILSIRKDSQNYPVISPGRNWKDEQGLHVLVMLINHQVQEVFFDTTDFCWYLRSSSGQISKA